MCPGNWFLILDLMTRVVFFFRFNAEASHCMSEEAWIKQVPEPWALSLSHLVTHGFAIFK